MKIELTTTISNTGDYEMTFITVPELSEQENKALVDKFVKIVTDAGGKVVNLEHWGQRKLAYPIKKRNLGYYSLCEFNAPGTVIAKLEQEFIYDEQILRYLTVKLNRDAVVYNVKRREQGFGKKKKTEETKVEGK